MPEKCASALRLVNIARQYGKASTDAKEPWPWLTAHSIAT
jgi:hypothetical protein